MYTPLSPKLLQVISVVTNNDGNLLFLSFFKVAVPFVVYFLSRRSGHFTITIIKTIR